MNNSFQPPETKPPLGQEGRAKVLAGSLCVVKDGFDELTGFVRDAWQTKYGQNMEEFVPVSTEDTWERLLCMRGVLSQQEARGLVRSSIASLANTSKFDIVSPTGFRLVYPSNLNDITKKAYSIHRDTWYHLPQHSINVWVALFGASSGSTFEIYPTLFDKKVPNTSHLFDPTLWMQGQAPVLPEAESKAVDGHVAERVHLEDGEAVVFASHQLHHTTQDIQRLRMSLDIRVAFEEDAGLGPSNIDHMV